MSRYEKLLQKPERLARIIGINSKSFFTLVERMYGLWHEAEQKRLCNRKRKRAIGGGRKYKLETMEQKTLLIIMFYRYNVTCELLGFWFDLDASNVTRLIGKLSKIFEQAADPELRSRLLEAKKHAEKTSTEFDFFNMYPELKEACIDATEHKKQRSKCPEKRKLDYSGKKKMFSNKTQIIIDSKQRIIDVSKTYPGSIHDKKIFNEDETIKRMPKQTNYLKDLGYLGIQKENPEYKIILPYKKKKGQKELTLEQKEFNTKHARRRVPVEHVFGRIKKFRICSETYRRKEENYNQMFRNVAALVNLNYCST